MPRLLFFAPCDNVLVSGPSNSVSLIVIISQITFPPGLPEPLPPQVPLRWFVFTQWEIEAPEAGFEFEQKLEMIGGDRAAPLLENTAAFRAQEQGGGYIHQMVTQLFAFPLAAAGRYRLHLSIRPRGRENWTQVGDYPIQVMYAAAPAQLPQ